MGTHPIFESDFDCLTEKNEFYFFKQHDYDGNNQLDGIELIQAMTHYERMDIEDRGGDPTGYVRFSEEQFLDMVNGILKSQDKNEDGYVDYFEFSKSQAERAAKANET